jgi:hypothetical protein
MILCREGRGTSPRVERENCGFPIKAFGNDRNKDRF